MSTFHKKYLEKSIVISLPLDSTLPMAWQTVLKKQQKQKRGWQSKKSIKEAKTEQCFSVPKCGCHAQVFNLELPILSLSSINIQFSSHFLYLGLGGFFIHYKVTYK